MPNEKLFCPKLKLEFMGEPLFMLIPPKLSSKIDDGDCPPHWLAGDGFPWADKFEPGKGDISRRPLGKKGEADVGS